MRKVRLGDEIARAACLADGAGSGGVARYQQDRRAALLAGEALAQVETRSVREPDVHQHTMSTRMATQEAAGAWPAGAGSSGLRRNCQPVSLSPGARRATLRITSWKAAISPAPSGSVVARTAHRKDPRRESRAGQTGTSLRVIRRSWSATSIASRKLEVSNEKRTR